MAAVRKWRVLVFGMLVAGIVPATSAGAASGRVDPEDLGASPGAGTAAVTAIAEDGRVIGLSGGHGVVWDSGRVLDLGAGAVPRAVSNRELDPDQGAEAAVRCDTGGCALLPNSDRLTVTDVSVSAINDFGQIAGTLRTPAGTAAREPHPFLWRRGTMIDLGPLPEGTETAAVDVDNAGEIVGTSTRADVERPVRWRLSPAAERAGRAAARTRSAPPAR
ncbi:hypothetical protein [Amycolatopsis anabasis]|uniref:hypothetical protein n=1 Tax=Amycolatopsis anabasis TaxID=1840409 RepID=UPI00131C0B9A|nr:hypothetical protein [Amycolatopsis anabasis]